MTDSPDPSRLLASAALDNEVTAMERAQVTASAALSEELEVYRTLSAELADVEVPAAARESGIATALTLFDEIRTDTGAHAAGAMAAATSPVGRVVSLTARRQRQSRWLSGAAAAAIVGILGFAVINSAGGGDDKKSSSATVGQRTETADSVNKTASADAGASAPAAESHTAATAAGTAGDVPQIAAATATVVPESTAAANDPWASAPSFNATSEILAYAVGAGSPLFSASSTTAPAAAADTAASTAGSTADAPVLPAPYAACSATPSGPTAPIIYMGKRLIVVRNDVLEQLEIIDPNTCIILFTIALP